jgi:hypothetical protein
MDTLAILETAQRPMRDYQALFGPVPQGLLKLAATWGNSGLLLAALVKAVQDGKQIEDWSSFVPTAAKAPNLVP